jgi:hypothetical protein
MFVILHPQGFPTAELSDTSEPSRFFYSSNLPDPEPQKRVNLDKILSTLNLPPKHMSDPLSPLDLKFLPDWLKETPSTNKYANFHGESEGRFDRDRSSRGPSRGGPDRANTGNERRSERPDRGSNRRPGGPDNKGRGADRYARDDRRRDSGNRDQGRGPSQGSRSPRPHFTPPQFKVDFLPEEGAAASIAKQIRQSSRAYPLFGTARLFLEKPERHFIRVTSSDPAKPLFQLEDGPISFERDLISRNAFRLCKDKFYREEVREVEPPKGNYTSVARCRSNGMLLGPTNHHAYQVAIRKLYEERFSRRMSFVQFQKEEIEVVSSEQAVADWKEQASKQTVFHTINEANEADRLEFKSLQEVEAHFNKNHLESLIKSGVSLECSGKSARDLPERFLSVAVREAFDRELAYPASLVHGLRPYFNEQNLQVFKHRKRVLYLSSVRPKPVSSSNEFADGPATLLTIIGESPRISKREIAIKILGVTDPESPESPETTARKTQLAADLHYLVHTGHVIEFADGKLDLPLSPAAQASTENAASDDDGLVEDRNTTAGSEASEGVSAESAGAQQENIGATETFGETQSAHAESKIPSPSLDPLAVTISDPITELTEVDESLHNTQDGSVVHSDESSETHETLESLGDGVAETKTSEPDSAHTE